MSKRRTRFAPSPTGFMHIGNLRSALYAYLVAKHEGGTFILRIEDTDQERLVEGATEMIYQTLETCGLKHDEGPDVGGPCAPYVQSERLDHYKPYAEQLVKDGKAYRCFCTKERLESLAEGENSFGYDRHCRDLDPALEAQYLAEGRPYVIRQKMPLEGETTFFDAVYGEISVKNEELEDQVLLKSDGFPTYNFANVIDDHEMGITHVVRGSEYLSSTPKYNLLYEALGWEKPVYVHLPLILGTDGKKLSKRHGATNFADLVAEGYLPEAIMNYIAFLGWAPGDDTREIFSLPELIEAFSEKGISKSPAVFDYVKLAWYNEQYIRAMEPAKFADYLDEPLTAFFGERPARLDVLAEILQPRLTKLSDLPELLGFFKMPGEYTAELFTHKKSKLNPALCRQVLERLIPAVEALPNFEREPLHELLNGLAAEMELKTGQVMGPPRLALSGQQVTPGGVLEIALILGRDETLKRLKAALAFLKTVEE